MQAMLPGSISPSKGSAAACLHLVVARHHHEEPYWNLRQKEKRLSLYVLIKISSYILN